MVSSPYITEDPPYEHTHTHTHADGEVAFALADGLLVGLPLVGPAGLGDVGGLLPPQTLTQLVHLRGDVLPGTADTERNSGLVVDQMEISI